jgi:hypothetical protein
LLCRILPMFSTGILGSIAPGTYHIVLLMSRCTLWPESCLSVFNSFQCCRSSFLSRLGEYGRNRLRSRPPESQYLYQGTLITLRSALILPTYISGCFAPLLASFRTRSRLQIEILALRHQLGALQRSVKRPKLTAYDRLFCA